MKLSILVSLFFISFGLPAETTPTVRLNQSLSFIDDMQFKNLGLAIQRQLKSFDTMGLKGTISFGDDVYPKAALKESLLLLKNLSEKADQCLLTNLEYVCQNTFNVEMNKLFNVYVPIKGKRKEDLVNKTTTKFTSYYSPDMNGSRIPTDRFKRPIYKNPGSPHDNYTRADIDYNGALAGKGYEIFWVEESFYDLYLLHVQGGGRINILNPDGTKEVKYLSYDGKNAHSFQMVYHYMLAQGYIKPEAAGIPNQRRFLSENPDKEEEVFGSCPSYVYFKESEEEPVGLNNIPLTEGRSLAIDSRIYKTMGMINFVKTVRASHLDENGKLIKVPFSRFFISQDTGGAIRGNARCDLYFGYGPMAELTAYNMNEQGEQYFLIRKNIKRDSQNQKN